MLLVFLFSLLMVFGIVAMFLKEWNDGWLISGVMSFVIAVCLFIGLVGIWSGSYNDNARMISLAKNIPTYELAANQINQLSVVSPVANGTMIGGLENMKQSTNASEVYKEYRDAKILLVDMIENRRAAVVNPWTSWIVRPLPTQLEKY
jgi:hypothetical protein